MPSESETTLGQTLLEAAHGKTKEMMSKHAYESPQVFQEIETHLDDYYTFALRVLEKVKESLSQDE